MASVTFNFHPSLYSCQTRHPLELPDTLEHIFGFCSFEDMKACRRVSKLWLDCLKRAWKSSTKAIVTPGRIGRRYTGMMDYLEIMKTKDSSRLPINYTLNASLRPNLRFWTICGNSITFLELKSTFPSRISSLLKLMHDRCPNLEHLSVYYMHGGIRLFKDEPTEWVKPQFGANRKVESLKIQCDVNGDDSPALPDAVSKLELLTHFPSLKTLTVVHRWWRCDCEPDKWFRAIEIIRKHDANYVKPEVNFKNLNMYGLIDE